MSLSVNIEKLKKYKDNRNWKAWEMTVRAYLEMEDLWNVVEHEHNGSEEDVQKDKRARFILMALLDAKQFDYMGPVPTANAVWRSLHNAHQSY